MGGRGKGAVITLVERTTRFVLLAPLPEGFEDRLRRIVPAPRLDAVRARNGARELSDRAHRMKNKAIMPI